MGGFFGVASTQDCVAELFYGTDYHSHLGTRRAGMVVRGGDGFKRFIHDISNTQFRAKFEDHLPELHGTQGIGVISDYEDQPLLIGSHHGLYGIVTVGRVLNIEELATKAFRDHSGHLSEISGSEFNATEVVATLINEGKTFEEGIRHAQDVIEGSCTLMLLTKKGLYVARDKLGRTPVVIGKKPGAYAATMESCSLPNLGFTTERYLGPGEIVRLSPEGIEQLAPPGDQMQICTFLWVYYGFPASTYEDINVEAARNRCGVALARADDTEVDFVAGIPDSGIGHAIGYAAEKNLPYRRPFVKYTPTWPRSFMPQEQRVRDLVARMKLIPIRELIEGNRLLFCEDSIVRGTQLRDIIQRLFDYGAKEIHMRPACPPLVHSCKYLNFSQSKSELDLAARKAVMTLERNPEDHLDDYANPSTRRYARMIDHIGDQLGLTSLKYQRLEDMVEAIGLPRDKVCTYCWNGCEGNGCQG
ncbi:MAG: amidophosphoribosyltransferase [Deltaproteobacteria bacterium]|nr:amidophosphoribosyltransferase [Deltaproteobacteria bacterium]